MREGEEDGVREGVRTWKEKEEETGGRRHEMWGHPIRVSFIRGLPRRRLCTGST